MTALAFAVKLLSMLPDLISAGKDISDLVRHGNDKLKQMQAEKRDPTPAEWDELDAKIKVLQEELHR